jgi:hypothetical protein
MRPTSDPDSDFHDDRRPHDVITGDPDGDLDRDADGDPDRVHPEAHEPNPGPWAEAPAHLRAEDAVPAQREPDHDGQLYVGAAHPDTELTDHEAAQHEPIPVDEAGDPIDPDLDEPRAGWATHDDTHDATDDDERPADTAHTAHDDLARDDLARDDLARDDLARDDLADDEAARDAAAHDHVDSDDAPFETAHDETAHDETAHDETAHDEAARAEAARPEPTVLGVSPLTPVTVAHVEPDTANRDTDEVGEPPSAVPVPSDADDQAEPAADADNDGGLKPGDVPVSVVAFLAEDAVQDLRQRWREAQLGFVDDPRQATEDVRNLVNEAIDKVTSALQSQRDQLGDGPTGDTEHYRVTVQRCRVFFDRLLNL